MTVTAPDPKTSDIETRAAGIATLLECVSESANGFAPNELDGDQEMIVHFLIDNVSSAEFWLERLQRTLGEAEIERADLEEEARREEPQPPEFRPVGRQPELFADRAEVEN